MSSRNGRVALIAQQRAALELYRQGVSREDIAAQVGVNLHSLGQWLTVADAVDPEGDDFIPLSEVPRLVKMARGTLTELRQRGELVVGTRNGKLVMRRREVELLQRRGKRYAVRKGTKRR